MIPGTSLFLQRASKYIHGTLENTSMGITNLMGPMEQLAVAGNPINGLYFVVTGAPQVHVNSLENNFRSKFNTINELKNGLF